MNRRLDIAVAVIGGAAGVIGLSLDAIDIFPSVTTVSPANPVARSWPDAFVYFWTFFTHLTNLGLLLVYASAYSRARWLDWFRLPQSRAAIGAYILLVGLYYHFMLAPTLTLTGNVAIATWLLHYVAPIAYIVWWAVGSVPHGRLNIGDLPVMLIPGLGYVGFVLLRGSVVGEYPYDILDAGKFGYLQVGMGVLTLLIAVMLFSVKFIAVDRWLGARKVTT